MCAFGVNWPFKLIGVGFFISLHVCFKHISRTDGRRIAVQSPDRLTEKHRID